MVQDIVTFIIDSIMLVGSDGFFACAMVAPFIFFVIRQIFVIFNMLLRGLYKQW